MPEGCGRQGGGQRPLKGGGKKNVSRQAVARCLKKCGLQSVKVKRKQMLTEKHKEKREARVPEGKRELLVPPTYLLLCPPTLLPAALPPSVAARICHAGRPITYFVGPT